MAKDNRLSVVSMATDFLATCCGLPAAIYFISSNKRRQFVQKHSTRQSPFFEILRDHRGFSQAEESLLNEKFGNLSSSLIPYEFEKVTFQGALVCYLFRVEEFYIFIGPVWNASRLQFDEKDGFRNNIVDRIKAFLNQTPSANSGFRTEKISRFLVHDTSIVEDDFLDRIRTFEKALKFIIYNIDTVSSLHPNDLEVVCRSTVFFLDIPSSKSVVGGIRGGQLIFTPPSDNDIDQPKIFLSTTNGKLALFTEKPLSKYIDAHRETKEFEHDWSKLSDQFRVERNAYFLERILMLRIWLQEEFSGFAVNSETAEGQEATFNELCGIINKFVGSQNVALFKYVCGQDVEVESYSEGSGKLHMLGASFGGGKNSSTFEGIKRKVLERGSNAQSRTNSCVYLCADQKKVVSQQPRRTAHEGFPDEVMIAVPLLSRGRLWGVLKFGVEPARLHRRLERWSLEVASVLTPYLYDHWMLHYFREINRSSVSRLTSEEKFSTILNAVRKLFLGASAQLFIQDSKMTARYDRKCSSGVDCSAQSPEYLLITEEETRVAQIINGDSSWGSFRLGRGAELEPNSFDKLTQFGFRNAGVLAIKNSSGSCFSAIVILSTDDEEFSGQWAILADSVSGLLATALEALHLQELKVEERTDLIAHTIKNRADRVIQGSQTISNRLAPIFDDEDTIKSMPKLLDEVEAISALLSTRGGVGLSAEGRKSLTALRSFFGANSHHVKGEVFSIVKVFADFKSHVHEIRNSAIVLSGGRNKEHPAQADPDDWKGTWATIRGSILRACKPYEAQNSQYAITSQLHKSILPWSWYCRIPEQTLIEIFSNIIDNAMKYDFSPPSVIVKVNSTGPLYKSIEIRNLAPIVTEYEARRLLEPNERGSYASTKDKDGSGIGLAFIRSHARAWSLEFEYLPAIHAVKNSNYGWHRAILRLPVEVRGEQ